MPQLTDYLPLTVVLLGALAVFVAIVWLMVNGRRLGVGGALGLLWAALLWVPFNRPVEGPILMRLGDDKGLTLADLLTVAASLLAVWRMVGANRSEQADPSPVSVKSSL